MKIIHKVICTMLLLVAPILVKAQNNQEKSIVSCEFTVSGVCSMCKERIEEAALIKGVKMAEWDKNSGVLKAVYRGDKVTEKEIHEAIAAVGHSTDQIEANDEAYGKLPDCCAYKDGQHKH